MSDSAPVSHATTSSSTPARRAVIDAASVNIRSIATTRTGASARRISGVPWNSRSASRQRTSSGSRTESTSRTGITPSLTHAGVASTRLSAFAGQSALQVAQVDGAGNASTSNAVGT